MQKGKIAGVLYLYSSLSSLLMDTRPLDLDDLLLAQ